MPAMKLKEGKPGKPPGNNTKKADDSEFFIIGLPVRGSKNFYKIKVLILYKTATFLSCLRENLY
ncbi:hypothetical protein [Methanosarcina sp. WWM596]|uniref:hypothetical protein n=1 Tax=Methanosarcina sp. WWM596 TaxID=1434103 RepID=UPI000A8E0728|nr:hypothetical protein [Methanosarcina sp. WWM596]